MLKATEFGCTIHPLERPALCQGLAGSAAAAGQTELAVGVPKGISFHSVLGSLKSQERLKKGLRQA